MKKQEIEKAITELDKKISYAIELVNQQSDAIFNIDTKVSYIQECCTEGEEDENQPKEKKKSIKRPPIHTHHKKVKHILKLWKKEPSKIYTPKLLAKKMKLQKDSPREILRNNVCYHHGNDIAKGVFKRVQNGQYMCYHHPDFVKTKSQPSPEHQREGRFLVDFLQFSKLTTDQTELKINFEENLDSIIGRLTVRDQLYYQDVDRSYTTLREFLNSEKRIKHRLEKLSNQGKKKGIRPGRVEKVIIDGKVKYRFPISNSEKEKK